MKNRTRTGAAFDSLLLRRRGKRAQHRVLDKEMRLLPTTAGQVRIMDTGGSGPVLVCTPDAPCVIEHYRALIDELRNGFRVVCFEMPGTGFSYPAPGYSFGLTEAADCVIELLDELAVEKAVLAFTCANGFVALNVAKRHPERVSHLVLAQTPSIESMLEWAKRVIPPPLKVPFVGQALMAATSRMVAVKWFASALPDGSPHRAAFAAQAETALREGGCFCLASMVQGLLGISSDQVAGIAQPTLLVHGDADRTHRRTDFASLRRLVPQTEVITFPGCGHFPELEATGVFVERLRTFAKA